MGLGCGFSIYAVPSYCKSPIFQGEESLGGRGKPEEASEGHRRNEDEGGFKSIFELRTKLRVTAAFYTTEGCNYM